MRLKLKDGRELVTRVLLAASGMLCRAHPAAGVALMAADGYARTWKERREPLPLENGVPGLFAAGDVSAGCMNRVASAVGEGSMVVRLAHEYLALT
jgi:thioredoxin reductase